MKHDKNYREIKADAEGFRQTEKGLDKKATPNRSLNNAVKNMIPYAIDNAVDYSDYVNDKKTSDAKRKAIHVAAKIPKGLVVGGSAAYAGKAIKDSVPIRKRIKELKSKEELTEEEKAELAKLKTKLKSYNKKAIAGAAIGTAASVGITPILNKRRINASNYYYKRNKDD